MVFFQNTSQKCWLTNGLRNLAIALWLIFKKKKQWNKTMFWGQYSKFFFFFIFTHPHWLPSSPSVLPLLAYFCLRARTWQWARPKSRAYFCKKGFWVCNSCTTLPSPGCCARLNQCCGNDPADLPSPTPAASSGQLLSPDRGDRRRAVSEG